jgi:endonuclease YncB( thermonuclease family)
VLRICSCFSLIVALSFAVQAHAIEIAGTIRVVDGDTIDVGQTRIRIHGIDAPERGQPCTTLGGQNWSCGDWVTRQVQDRYAGRQGRCTPLETDRYGRTVARCTVQGQDIGQVLVREGIAFAYRRYSQDYVADEVIAQSADRGIHDFQIQSLARYRITKIKGRTAPDPDCRIKGNISGKSMRIYHMPGQNWYEKTGINAAKGERWFCSEAQACASGWRRAKR